MVTDALLVAACAGTALGSAVLRFAWSLPRRSRIWNGAGWGLFTIGGLFGWLGAGAWGASVASLFGMGSALLFLAHAAATAPTTADAKPSSRRAGALPEAGEPWRLGRRIATFLLVVLGGMIASTSLAVAARTLLAWSGAGEANANVASFFVMPLAWTLLAFALLMEQSREQQWRLLAMSALPGVLAAVFGLAA
jgi:hypothetical protein